MTVWIILKHLKKTKTEFVFFIEDLFKDLGIPENEQIILWKMFKGTIGCRKLGYYLLKLKGKM